MVALHRSQRRLDQVRKNRLQIERRAADDLQHVGGGGLLLQRLGKVARARLHLVEQPHVLDRDDGLVGEGLHEFDQTGRKVARFRRDVTNTPSTLLSRSKGTPQE